MVSGGPYGLEDIIGMAGFGRALLLLAIVPILWSLPTALMVGELASAIPDEGGFYVWAHRALGRFWGFQVAWLSLASSVFDMAIYPTTVSLYLMTVFPELKHGHYALLLKLSIVIIATLWNLRGAVSVGHGSVRMMAISLAPFAVMLLIAIWRIAHGGLHLAAGPQTLTYDLGGALSVTMWNYMGWDNASTIAQEVENPQRDYPRAMLVSALCVMCVYMLPLLAVWAVGIPAARFSTGAWADAAGLLGGSVLAMSVVLAGSLDGLGTFNALTLTLTRLPYAMAEDRPPSPHPHPPHTQRSPLGLRPRLRHHLGTRARPHLRAPHLHRPRPLGSLAHPRVPLPHRPPAHRARTQTPLPHPRQSARTHPHRLRPDAASRLRPLQRPHRKTRRHQRAPLRLNHRHRRPHRLRAHEPHPPPHRMTQKQKGPAFADPSDENLVALLLRGLRLVRLFLLLVV